MKVFGGRDRSGAEYWVKFCHAATWPREGTGMAARAEPAAADMQSEVVGIRAMLADIMRSLNPTAHPGMYILPQLQSEPPSRLHASRSYAQSLTWNSPTLSQSARQLQVRKSRSVRVVTVRSPCTWWRLPRAQGTLRPSAASASSRATSQSRTHRRCATAVGLVLSRLSALHEGPRLAYADVIKMTASRPPVGQAASRAQGTTISERAQQARRRHAGAPSVWKANRCRSWNGCCTRKWGTQQWGRTRQRCWLLPRACETCAWAVFLQLSPMRTPSWRSCSKVLSQVASAASATLVWRA